MSRRWRVRRRDEGGYVAMLGAMLVAAVILPLAAMAVDIARIYVEIERVQNAADAAATAGVTFLPDDFANARATAIAVAARNGYGNSGDYSVDVSVGAKPTQLKVTVSHEISNAFGAAFGVGHADVSRSAVADYNGPAPLGSPCNTFGNEPPGTAALGPIASVLSAAAGGATCSTSPQFWGAVAGPATDKLSGDRYMTRTCSSGVAGCTGTTNNEFKATGYIYSVRATPAAVGHTVRLQIYDPAWVEQADNCTAAPSSGTVTNDDWNNYAKTDAKTRYAKAANAYCPGDTYAAGDPIVTSFGLRRPTDTQQPLSGVPVTGCAKQYGGYKKAAVTDKSLKRGDPAYNENLVKVFRQWVTMCDFYVAEAGDYYLQVRTNVPVQTSVPVGADGARATTAVFTQTGDNTTVNGAGNNRFALRVANAPAGSVSISGWQNMSMYMNYAGAEAEFNLVRVVPAAATKSLIIELFDVGDATNAGTITVLKPTDSNLPDPVQGCVGSGVRTGALSGCAIDNVSSSAGFNGKTQVIRVPIPATYTCNVGQAGGCWFRVRFAFPGAVPSDTTTWSAQVSGDPVRLIE